MREQAWGHANPPSDFLKASLAVLKGSGWGMSALRGNQRSGGKCVRGAEGAGRGGVSEARPTGES